MASSEYLSTKSEEGDSKTSGQSGCVYGHCLHHNGGGAGSSVYFHRECTGSIGIDACHGATIIALFNYYYAVARGESFKKRFLEMAILSFTVAGISFLIGYALKTLTGIDAA